jgi:hypothetical protein
VKNDNVGIDQLLLVSLAIMSKTKQVGVIR